GGRGGRRLVARHIKTLLREGVAAEDVLVTMRDVRPYADLVREVFAEYGIPADVEGADPLTRCPAGALLLRALRLPEDDWPFAGVTALLRSSCFRPRWPEARFDPDVPQLAEGLLRLLGEPRGADAYLAAARRGRAAHGPGGRAGRGVAPPPHPRAGQEVRPLPRALLPRLGRHARAGPTGRARRLGAGVRGRPRPRAGHQRGRRGRGRLAA